MLNAVRQTAMMALAAAWLALGGGCQPSQSDPAPPEATSSEQPGASGEAVESWDLIFLQDQPVGWQSMRLVTSAEDGQVFHDGVARSQLTVRRFGQVTSETIQLSSRQTATGSMVSLSTELGAGGSRNVTAGECTGGRLVLTAEQSGTKREWEIAVAPHCGGFFAVEWSLRQQPLQPGERRQLQAFLPLIHQVTTITLEALNWEQVMLGQRAARLLRVSQQIQIDPNQVMESLAWVDAQGAIWKTEIPAIRQVTYRVTESEALEVTGRSWLDLGAATTIRVTHDLTSPHDTRLVRYRIRSQSDGGVLAFPATALQTVQALGGRAIELTVRAPSAAVFAVNEAVVDAPPDDADSQPSAMIQADDALVRQLVTEIPFERDATPLARALAIERWVHQAIQQKDFSTAFASAAEVARSRQGDCTEHAVLTAALCRAAGIPARVLVGLVYVPSQQGFAFHMWNEAWVGSHWQPLDSTLGLGRIGAAHLVLVRSSLATESTWSALLPVLSVMGQLEIDILEVVTE
jgi:transglutaminase-like putative cysteine protease